MSSSSCKLLENFFTGWQRPQNRFAWIAIAPDFQGKTGTGRRPRGRSIRGATTF